MGVFQAELPTSGRMNATARRASAQRPTAPRSRPRSRLSHRATISAAGRVANSTRRRGIAYCSTGSFDSGSQGSGMEVWWPRSLRWAPSANTAATASDPPISHAVRLRRCCHMNTTISTISGRPK